ncbi:MAG: transglycosylase domain-containing protein, partial [Treponema sp.]|nr:transglycosylase domain-containing protein [Treponema sp.]
MSDRIKKKRGLLFLLLGIGLLPLLFCLGLRLWPDGQLDAFMHRQNSTRFYDCNNELLYVMPLQDGLRREYYKLEDFPDELVKIFVREEDSRFFRHWGI